MNTRLQSIQVKIVLWAGGCLLIMGVALVTYGALSLRNTATKAAEQNLLALAEARANKIEGELDTVLDSARTMAQALEAVKTESSVNLTRAQVNAMLKRVLLDNPQFLGVYTLWEPNAFDNRDAEYANTAGHDETGRFIPYWIRDEQGNAVVEPLVDYEVEGAGDWYLLPKRTKRENILDPFMYPVAGEDVLMTSLVVPIVVDGQFYGITGVDIRADFLQELADNTDAFDGTADLLLIGNHGTLAGITGQPEQLGNHMKVYHTDWEEDLGYIQNGETVYEADEGHIAAFVPIHIGQTGTPWSANLNVPTRKTLAEANRLVWQMVGISVVIFIGVLILLWFLAGRLAKPLVIMADRASNISLKGELNRGVSVAAR